MPRKAKAEEGGQPLATEDLAGAAQEHTQQLALRDRQCEPLAAPARGPSEGIHRESSDAQDLVAVAGAPRRRRAPPPRGVTPRPRPFPLPPPPPGVLFMRRPPPPPS